MTVTVTVTTHEIPTTAGTDLRVTLAGELDLSTTRHLYGSAPAWLESGPRRVTLDLSRLEFCDAAGLRTLLDLEHQLATRGIPLVLAAPQTTIARVLALTGLDQHFTIQSALNPPAGVG